MACLAHTRCAVCGVQCAVCGEWRVWGVKRCVCGVCGELFTRLQRAVDEGHPRHLGPEVRLLLLDPFDALPQMELLHLPRPSQPQVHLPLLLPLPLHTLEAVTCPCGGTRPIVNPSNWTGVHFAGCWVLGCDGLALRPNAARSLAQSPPRPPAWCVCVCAYR